MEKQTLENLRTQHPGVELHAIRCAGEEIVVRPPTAAEFERFTLNMERESRTKALGALLFSCAVHPSMEALQSLLDRRAGLVFSFGNELCKIAGLNQEAESQKL